MAMAAIGRLRPHIKVEACACVRNAWLETFYYYVNPLLNFISSLLEAYFSPFQVRQTTYHSVFDVSVNF